MLERGSERKEEQWSVRGAGSGFCFEGLLSWDLLLRLHWRRRHRRRPNPPHGPTAAARRHNGGGAGGSLALALSADRDLPYVAVRTQLCRARASPDARRVMVGGLMACTPHVVTLAFLGPGDSNPTSCRNLDMKLS